MLLLRRAAARCRSWLAVPLAALGLLVATLSVATPASASASGLLDLTCTPLTSSAVSTYSPALTLSPQQSSSTFSFHLDGCVSLSQPQVTSGGFEKSSPPRSRSCLDVLGTGSGQDVVTWNTGQTSTLSTTRTTTVAAAVLVVTLTGTVTSGLFQGDTVVITQTGPALDILACTAGLGSVSRIDALVTVEITSL